MTNANPEHDGFPFLRLPFDQFELNTPQGIHFCLVYAPMRGTLFQFQHNLPSHRLPLQFLKLYMYCLLQAVDYLHTECQLIHTGTLA